MAHLIDGKLDDWMKNDRIDLPGEGASGFALYGTLETLPEGKFYIFALQAPDALLPNTKLWLNTDRNTATGFQSFTGAETGAEYYVNFYDDGKPYLYSTTSAGVPGPAVALDFKYSTDGRTIEFSIPQAQLTPGDTDLTLDLKVNVNHGTAGAPQAAALPGYFGAGSLTVYDPATLPPHPADAHKIGIVYSETTAAKYFAPMAYSQLFMAAQNQAVAAGLSFDVLSEADLKNLTKIAAYDTLVFPSFGNVNKNDVAPIQDNLTQAVYKYGVNLIAAGNFMTNDETGAALGADPYIRMKTLLNLESAGNTGTVPIEVKANDLSNPMLAGYTANEVIHSYASMNSNYYNSADGTAVSHIATMSFGSGTADAVIGTQTGGRNVHFANESLLGDNNMLQHALDYVEKPAAGPELSLNISRSAAVVASRSDLDQAQETADVQAGIYDKMLPILAQWKADYNFVGSYYIDIGSGTAQNPGAGYTDWAKSKPYYDQILAMGNEIGSHSITHPEDTNKLNAASIQAEFEGSNKIIKDNLGLTVMGAAVPGAPELLPTAQEIEKYYTYITGGTTLIGAGYPGAIGHLTPTDSKIYIAPNVPSDFTLVGFQLKTADQASAVWQQSIKDLSSHSDLPVIVWPWHDYGVTAWPSDGVASKYTTGMYTSFIKTAYEAGSEFVTLADLAERESAFDAASFTYAFNATANAVSAVVGSTDAGKFSLDLGNTATIKSVTGYYAYDANSVFVDRDGGTFQINLGATPDDVTHITKVADRGDLVSVKGDGTNLEFSVTGEGHMLVDLAATAGRQVVVTGAGATISSLVDDKLDILLTGRDTHSVKVELVPITTNHPPTVSALTGVATEGGLDVSIDLLSGATDPDAGETATLAVANLTYSIDGTGSPTIPAGLSYDPTTHTLTVDSKNTAFDPLALDAKRVLVASYDVTDTHGAKTAQTLTLTVTGTNDAPKVDAALAATVTEGGPRTSFDLLSGATDPDAGETATLTVANLAYTIDGAGSTTVPAGLSYDPGTHKLTVDPGDATLTPLAAGAQRVFGLSYDVTDVHGASVHQTETLKVTGIDGTPPPVTPPVTPPITPPVQPSGPPQAGNQSPMVLGPLTASVMEDSAIARFDLLAGAGDPDAGETNALTIEHLVFSTDGGMPSELAPNGLRYDAATHTLIVDPFDAGFDDLTAKDQRVFVATYDITDIHGASVHQTQTLTVLGADAVTISETGAPPVAPPSTSLGSTPTLLEPPPTPVVTIPEAGTPPVAPPSTPPGSTPILPEPTPTPTSPDLPPPVSPPPPANAAPVALGDVGSAVAYKTTAVGNVLANDSDPAGEALHVGTVQFGGGVAVSLPTSGSAQVTGLHGTLTIAANGDYRYAATSAGSDTFTYSAVDPGGLGAGATLRIDSIKVALNASETFAFKLGEAAFDFSHGHSVMTAPSGTVTDLTGVGTITFADGTVRERDGQPGVDDLFYAARNPDVWQAGLDPDQHYAEYGWREGRNPNAEFSTSGYLNANPDVAAAGMNPLQHYSDFGWKEGRSAGADFSAEAYLARNPDVAAAGLNPLLHFEEYGKAEGRFAFPGAVTAANGHEIHGDFDATYYLAKYGDVAAAVPANRDAESYAFEHYNTYGWREGRDPNALFSTNGYLAANPAVAALGFNPLLHQEETGWRQGLSSGTAFDNSAYLAANPDVAAAQMDPLQHYLQYGMAEGRHLA